MRLGMLRKTIGNGFLTLLLLSCAPLALSAAVIADNNVSRSVMAEDNIYKSGESSALSASKKKGILKRLGKDSATHKNLKKSREKIRKYAKETTKRVNKLRKDVDKFNRDAKAYNAKSESSGFKVDLLSIETPTVQLK